MLFFTIALAMFLAEAEIDIVVPSFPELQRLFGISVFQTELLMTINLLCHCLIALVIGQYGDRYGKKRIFLIGMAGFILGTLCVLMSTSFGLMLFGRALQGAGMAAPMVLGYVIATESLARHVQRESRVALLNGITNLSLAITPSIGSFIALYLGWHGNFQALLILGIISFILCFIFLPQDQVNACSGIRDNFSDYRFLIDNQMVINRVVLVSLFSSGWFVFVALAPIIYTDALGTHLLEYGFYQGVVAAIFGVGSLLSVPFMRCAGKKLSLAISFLCMGFFILFCGLGNILSFSYTPWGIALLVILGDIGTIIPCNILYVIAIEALPHASSKISAMIIMLRWVFACLGIQIAAWFYNKSFLSTSNVMVLMFIMAITLFWITWCRDPDFRTRVLEID